MKLISTKSIFTILLFVVGLCNSAFAADGDQLFSEKFDACTSTGGNDNLWSGSVANGVFPSTLTDAGWTNVSGYAASGCIKLGTGSKQGSAITPAITGFDAAKSYTLKFRAGAWNSASENTVLMVTASSGTLSAGSVTLEKGAFKDYTLTISGASAGTKISFVAEKAGSNRFFLDDVSLVEGIPAPAAVATPVVSPAGGTYSEPQTITLTCETAEASIYYTLDGSDPTAQSLLYTAPFSLSATSTLKAIAIKGEDKSVISDKVAYVFSKAVTTLADLLAQSVDQTTPYVLTIPENNPVIILAHSGTNYYLQQGETNVWMYYKGTELAEAGSNMTVTGTITGTLTTYYGQTEFNVTSVANLGGGDVVTVTPVVVTATDFAATPSKYLFKLVTLTDYHFDADYQFVVTTAKSAPGKVGDVPIICYSQFNNLTKAVDVNHAYTITGIAGSYNADLQIYPLSDEGIVPSAILLTAPTFTPAAGAYTGEVNVTIANPDGKGTLYYTTDGTDPTTASTVYSGAIKLTETTTIKAFIVNGEDQSAIISSTYTIIPVANTISELKALVSTTDVPVALVATAENPITLANLYAATSYQFLEQNGEYICCYGSKVLPVVAVDGFESGATFSGTIFGVLKVYNRMVEFVPDSVKNIAIVGTKTLTPTVVGFGDFVANDSAYAGKLITLEGMFPTKDYTYVDAATGSVTLTNSESAKNVSFYNAFKLSGIGSVYATKKYDITGFVTVNSSARSLLPRTTSDIVSNTVGIDKVAADRMKIVSAAGQIVITAVSNETVTITDLTGAQVAKVAVSEGENTISLPAGIYVIKGQKVVVF